MRALRTAGTVGLLIANVVPAAASVAIGLAKFRGPEWPRKFEHWA